MYLYEKLSREEAAAVSIFKVGEAAVPNQARGDNLTFEEEMQLAVEMKKAAKGKAGYRSTLHIAATSNVVERLFSRTGIIMAPRRRCMDPSTLEMLVMLRYNKDMWSRETVQNIIDRAKAAAIARKRARNAEEAAEEAVGENLDEEG